MPGLKEEARLRSEYGKDRQQDHYLGKRWPELPVARKRAVLTAMIERIEVGVDQIDIRLRPARLNALLDAAPTPSQAATGDETEILSVPVRLRRSGREVRMLIGGTAPFATAQPDARLIKLLISARRFNAHSSTATARLLRHWPRGA
jgi:hypothetical protein